MNLIFNYDSPIFRFLGRVFDIVYLNILCLICCFPIVTIGPSVTALYYCFLKILRNRGSSVTRMFFYSFKTNLKQGILMTLLFFSFAIVLFIDIQICNVIDMEYIDYIKIFLYVILTFFVVIVSYAFPVLAQFDNTIGNILKYSLLMAMYNFGYTICIIIFNIIPFVVLIFMPEFFFRAFPAWLTFGFSMITMLNSKMFVRIFDKYVM